MDMKQIISPWDEINRLRKVNSALLEACDKAFKMLESGAWKEPGLHTAMLCVGEAHDALMDALALAKEQP